MALTSYPFDGQPVTESQFSKMFSYFQETGVARGGFATSADSSGLNVKVAPGEAFVKGFFVNLDATATLAVGQGDATNARIDTVILRLDMAANTIALAVKAGTPTAAPVAPALTQTSTGVYEYPLADVRVSKGAVNIAAGDVTDRRTYLGQRVGVWATNSRPSAGLGYPLGVNTANGALEVWNGARYATAAYLNSSLSGNTIHVSDAAPAASDGVNGDIWIEY